MEYGYCDDLYYFKYMNLFVLDDFGDYDDDFFFVNIK